MVRWPGRSQSVTTTKTQDSQRQQRSPPPARKRQSSVESNEAQVGDGGWESFDHNATAFPQETSGFNSKDSGFSDEDWAAPSYQPCIIRKNQQATPPTAASSTVTASTTPSSFADFSFSGSSSLGGNQKNGLQVLAPMVLLSSNHSIGSSQQAVSDNASLGSSPDVSHLLTFPVPEDRSERRRLKYEKERRMIGVELEPEGVRGQEAQVLDASTPEATRSSLPKRTFSCGGTSGDRKHEKRQIKAANSSTPQKTRPSNNSSSSNNNRPQHQSILHQSDPILRISKTTGQHVSVAKPSSPSQTDCLSSDSTASDEELREMLTDLLAETSLAGEEKKEEEVSLVAATAAAAAARALLTGGLSSSTTSKHQDHGTSLRSKESRTLDVEQLNRLAMEEVELGHFDSAISKFTRILDFQIKEHGKLHPSVASAHHNLGTAHAKRASALPQESLECQQARAVALESFQAAARTARDSLSPHHPNVAVSLVRIGFLLLHSKQYENAAITFREALRIRKLAYGSRHSLVANLYNNLGVCLMHLGDFEHGRKALSYALDIQRELLSLLSSGPSEADFTSDTNSSMGHSSKLAAEWTQSLEIADTLFNIGGLCLEWIRREGPHHARQQDAELSFREAFHIREKILGLEDPLTVQVSKLLALCESLPKFSGVTRVDSGPVPSSPKSQKSGLRSVGSNIDLPVLDESSKRGTKGGHSNTPPRFADRVSRNASSVSPGHVRPKSSVPAQGPSEPKTAKFSPVDNSVAVPPLRPTSRDRRRPSGDLTVATQTVSRTCACHHESSKIEKSPTLLNAAPLNCKADVAKEPISTRSLQNDPLVKSMQCVGYSRKEDRKSWESGGHDSIVSEKRVRGMSSKYEADKSPLAETGFQSGEGGHVPHSQRGTKVSVRNHIVPLSPGRQSQAKALYQNSPGADIDSLSEQKTQQTCYPFDVEENCLLGEMGIDSEYGRVHVPSAWAEVGMVCGGEWPEPRQHELVVTRPSRSGSPETMEALSKAQSAEADYDTLYETGNSERDEIMRRARAFIRAYENGLGNPKSAVDDACEHSDNNSFQTEDCLDQLGGGGGELFSSSQKRCGSMQEMIANPMEFLPHIHDEACRKLKQDDTSGAAHLFGMIVQCQRDRYGAVHEHVASALYNLGIAQLRGQNAKDAVETFKEATEIRKMTLGPDHAAVAVSQVKVGIAELLLHNFQEAMWNFCEALSVRKTALGTLHPSTARIYNNIGCVHVEFNEFREARKAFEKALDIQRHALGDDPDSRGTMLATATTLCNLAYIYRKRDLYAKAAVVLKEAADLQDTVLGRTNPTVLSTLDCLADCLAEGRQTCDALKIYNMILTRYRAGGTIGSQTISRAEAVLLYKMSRVHKQRNDRESQMDTLKLALRCVRSLRDDAANKDSLERCILYDMRSCREKLETNSLKWI